MGYCLYDINSVKKGLIVKELIQHENPQGMQGFAFNIRKDKFKDRRVRKALSYAFDFEWSNKNLFLMHIQEQIVFLKIQNLASSGLPSTSELNYLNPYFDVLPNEIFSEEYNKPCLLMVLVICVTQLQEASKLLKDLVGNLENGKLIHSSTKETFHLRFLLRSPAFERIVFRFKDNLEKLGIDC